MDKLIAWLPISFSLLSTSPEFFIGHTIFFPDLSYTVSQYFMTLALMAVRQEVNNYEISVVVQELEFAMNLMFFYDAWVTNTS